MVPFLSELNNYVMARVAVPLQIARLGREEHG